MAGYRLTLKKLASKYGIDIKGSSYRQVIEEIIKDNINRASKKMSEISNRRIKKAFEESIDNGIINLPEYAIPLVTVRKASQNGKMITDTLRDALTRGLREAISDNLTNTEEAINQMAKSVSDIMKQYQNVHSRVIAVTEVRSALDLSKYEYARLLLEKNPGRVLVTKKWVHNDHLVKTPRLTHKAIDGELVPFNQRFSIGLMYPHDPDAKAEEVIGCQCGYEISIEEMAMNQIIKELKEGLHVYRVYKAGAVNPATGKPYQIGETKVRPDGTEWVKTGTFSWAKKGTADAVQAQKKDSNKDDIVDSKDKKVWQDIEGQTAKQAEDIALSYGEKGIYQLTKGGLLNFLHAHGVEDPTSMKWQEKVDKFKEIVAGLKKPEKKIKTLGKEELTEKDLKIINNKDFIITPDKIRGNKNPKGKGDKILVETRHGHVNVELDENGITNESYDELMQKIDPIQGGHWGSANTDNATAISVALVNAPEWKPIDKLDDNGNLIEFKQDLSEYEYKKYLVKGLGLRKYAQEKLKHPAMSRENIPNFYRGMTVSTDQYVQLLGREVDTIELTGCTAISSFEEVADQYSSSNWTKGFGSDRKAIKLVIERDDYMDNSIGMFHPNIGRYNNGNENVAFELLSGAPSFYIKSVGKMGDWDASKYANEFIKSSGRDVDKDKRYYELVKDVDLDKIRNPNEYYEYQIEDPNGGEIIKAHDYGSAVNQIARARAKAEIADLNADLNVWTKQYYEDHIEDFFKKVKNKKIGHRNNDSLNLEWYRQVEEAFNKTPLKAKVDAIREAPTKSPYWTDYKILDSNINIMNPSDEEKETLYQIYNTDEVINDFKKRALQNPVKNLSPWNLVKEYTKWKDFQESKSNDGDFNSYTKKIKAKEKSYATQIKNTEQEYQQLKEHADWIKDFNDDIENQFQSMLKEYHEQHPDDGFVRYDKGKYSISYRFYHPIANNEQEKIHKLHNMIPYVSYDGSTYSPSDDGYDISKFINSEFYGKKLDIKRFDKLDNIRSEYDAYKNINRVVDKYLNNGNITDVRNRKKQVAEKIKQAKEGQNVTELNSELQDLNSAISIYSTYLLESAPKKPLEVRVSYGRGKKAISGGIDDIQGEENDK